MNLSDLLNRAGEAISAISESPRLDARLLLCHVLGLTEAGLLARPPDAPVDADRAALFQSLVDKRVAGYAVAYLTGRKEFFGRSFLVKEGVLIPRPDTEILIEAVLPRLSGFKTVRDVGTGSGAIALTLALEAPHIVAVGSDVSPVSQEIFASNKAALNASNASFRRADLLADGGRYDLIVANLPYLTPAETRDRMTAGWREPALALNGLGFDGLLLINTLITQSAGGCRMIALEADPRQMDAIETALRACGYARIERFCDLAGDERVIVGSPT